jgi:hypothetical protein
MGFLSSGKLGNRKTMWMLADTVGLLYDNLGGAKLLITAGHRHFVPLIV